MGRRENQQRKKRKQTKPVKKKSKIKSILFNLFLLLLLLFGLALTFNDKIKNFLVKNMTDTHQVNKVNAATIKKNKDKEADFDFDAVESIDLNAVLNARLHPEEVAILGGIAIPSVQLNLPIIKGVSNYSLIVGAGTMKPDQEMGKGNYALASHHMIQQNLLFGPLVNIEMGATIYLTDLEYIYVYETSFKEYVAPNRTELIEDVPDKTLVTLVTCDNTGAQRLVVQGTFKKKVPINQASNEMAKAFDIDVNNYE